MTPTADAIATEAENFWALHFCGCGQPDLAIEAFREIMDLFVEPTAENGLAAVQLDRGRYAAYEAKHGAGLALLLLYWIEAMDLAEHGTSAYGSWLTRLGERVREQVLSGELPECMDAGEDEI